jgi:7-cyano-7-deazaguanine synthase in queuosine biosynthesis
VRFLTGDYWEIVFREMKAEKKMKSHQPELIKKDNISQVALLSGGLDSFVGAIDALEQSGEKLILLSHYGQGGVIKPIQDQVLSLLKNHYSNRIISIQSFVQPPKAIEPSQRSRSILFLGLGVFICDGLGQKSQLLISENGFVSLNVPISANRIGSFSTRTTHPFFIHSIQKLISHLGLNVELVLPYKYKTKGEILDEVMDRQVLLDGVNLTRSCSKSNLRFYSYDPKGHCGVCMPCIIRMAALKRAGMSEGEYLFDISSSTKNLSKSEGETLRALKIFLERNKKRSGSKIFDLLSNGPIPDKSGSIGEYEAVFNRGLIELMDLLGQ